MLALKQNEIHTRCHPDANFWVGRDEVDVPSCPAPGRTALMAASLMGHPTVIAALLAAGDDVHATDDALKSAIMLAAQNDHVPGHS